MAGALERNTGKDGSRQFPHQRVHGSIVDFVQRVKESALRRAGESLLAGPVTLAPVAVGEYGGNVVFMAGKNRPSRVTQTLTLNPTEAAKLRRAARGKQLRITVSKPDSNGNITISLTGTQQKIDEANERSKFF